MNAIIVLPLSFASFVLSGTEISFAELLIHGYLATVVALILELFKELFKP